MEDQAEFLHAPSLREDGRHDGRAHPDEGILDPVVAREVTEERAERAPEGVRRDAGDPALRIPADPLRDLEQVVAERPGRDPFREEEPAEVVVRPAVAAERVAALLVDRACGVEKRVEAPIEIGERPRERRHGRGFSDVDRGDLPRCRGWSRGEATSGRSLQRGMEHGREGELPASECRFPRCERVTPLWRHAEGHTASACGGRGVLRNGFCKPCGGDDGARTRDLPRDSRRISLQHACSGVGMRSVAAWTPRSDLPPVSGKVTRLREPTSEGAGALRLYIAIPANRRPPPRIEPLTSVFGRGGQPLARRAYVVIPRKSC